MIQIDANSPFATAQEQSYPAGTLIISPSQGENDAWLVVGGRVRQYDVHPNGSEITLNTYKPGAVLSLTWLLGGASNSYFFAAETEVKIRKIPATKFVAYLKSNPELTLTMLERLSKGLDGMFMRIYSNSFNDAKQRVLFHIQVAAERFGTDMGDGTTKVQLSVTQLAADTGMARETVSRTLAKLQQEQLVSRTGKYFVVPKSE